MKRESAEFHEGFGKAIYWAVAVRAASHLRQNPHDSPQPRQRFPLLRDSTGWKREMKCRIRSGIVLEP